MGGKKEARANSINKIDYEISPMANSLLFPDIGVEYKPHCILYEPIKRAQLVLLMIAPAAEISIIKNLATTTHLLLVHGFLQFL